MYSCSCSGCSQKMEGVVWARQLFCHSDPQRDFQSEEKGLPALLQGLDQPANAQRAGEPRWPSKEVWRTREEMTNTWEQGKNNSLNFDCWLLWSWNSTWRWSGLCPPNCLHTQQLTSVKHPGPRVLCTTVLQTAEMGAQCDLTSFCVEVGFP